MQFSNIVAILAVAATGAVALPNSAPPASVCSSGTAACNTNGQWSKDTTNCATGNVFCCVSAGILSGLLDCSNLLDGNVVTIPIDILGGGINL